jgi:cofilin
MEVFQQIKKDHKWSYVIFKIGDDKKEIVVDKKGEKTESYDDFLGSLPKDGARFVVVDFAYTNKEGTKKEDLVFASWSPDGGVAVKEKMLYASSKDAIQKKLDGCKKYMQWNDGDDSSKEEVEKELSR